MHITLSCILLHDHHQEDSQSTNKLLTRRQRVTIALSSAKIVCNNIIALSLNKIARFSVTWMEAQQIWQVGTRPGGHSDMHPSRITDCHSADEMYSTICVELATAHLSLVPSTKICAKNDFYIFVPSDLDLLTFCPQICSPSYCCLALCFH